MTLPERCGGFRALAGDRAVLITCDLVDRDGPEVTSAQIGGSSKKRRFVGGPDGRRDDLRGRSCAEILAELGEDGFEFEAFQVFGRDATQGIWYFRSDD